jgi:hypothetical protein
MSKKSSVTTSLAGQLSKIVRNYKERENVAHYSDLVYADVVNYVHRSEFQFKRLKKIQVEKLTQQVLKDLCEEEGVNA